MEKKRIAREAALAAGYKVIDALTPFCERIEICGSLRRGWLEVGDVDIIAVARGEGPTAWAALETLAAAGARIRGGTGNAKLGCFDIDGVQVDVWLVPAESWGAALMFATGSKETNVRQRQHARRQGMILNQYGLWREADGGLIASETEQAVYAALGEPYREPWER